MQYQTKVGFKNVKTCQFHMFYAPNKKSSCQRALKRTRRRKAKVGTYCAGASHLASLLVSSVLLAFYWCGRCLKRPRLGPQGLKSSHGETAKLVSPPQRPFNVQSDVHQTRADHRRGQSQIISGTSALPLPSNRAVVSHKHQGEVGALVSWLSPESSS